MDYRIPLSGPDIGVDERAMLLDAFDFGSLDTWGAHVEGFEADMASYLGHEVEAVAVTSDSAAMHLAMILAGVGRDDLVLCPTLASATAVGAILEVGARPVLLDASPDTWNVDPQLLVDELRQASRRGKPLGAVVTVDLYGQCADYGSITEVAQEYGVALIEDASDSLGASYGGRPAGVLGDLGIFSFEAEQALTTSEGGMLVARGHEHASRARVLAGSGIPVDDDTAQPDAGLEYRLSDLLAAIGRAQLRSLDTKVARRQAIHQRYRDHLEGLPGVAFQSEPSASRGARRLTALTFDPTVSRCSRDEVLARLEDARIEARPVLAPLHARPALSGARSRDHGVADRLHRTGLCLPSGSTLTDAQVDEVADTIATALG